MAHFDQEKRQAQFEKLTPELIEAFNNPDYVDLVINIASKNHLAEARSKQLIATIGYLILGLIHPEDLEKEIIENTGVDPRIAKGISQEVRIKIIAPIAAELNKVHGFQIETLTPQAPPQASQPQQTNQLESKLEPPPPPPTPRPQPKPEPEPEKEVVIKPRVVNKEPTAPVVIHEHEERKSISEGTGYDGSLVRPSFYSPTRTGASEEQSGGAPSARLELGPTPQAQIEPQTTRVGRENASVVHYTKPDAPTDPFAVKPDAPQPEKPTPKPKVDPKNVVDLKDLPQ